MCKITFLQLCQSSRLMCWFTFLLLLGQVTSFLGCNRITLDKPKLLRIGVTTSTQDTGIIEVLVEKYNEQHSVRVDLIPGGTGQVLRLGKTGDVDLLLVHARSAEDAFMAAEHGIRREDIMYNTFEISGVADDPAGIRGLSAVEAFHAIEAAQSHFVSRGDESGTHKKELELWNAVGTQPAWDGYVETGQGMGATLVVADQLKAYVLTDRGTYLKFADKISLVPLVQSPQELRNPYGALVVNPAIHSAIQVDPAHSFVDFLISPEGQFIIQNYQVNGEQLFYPLHLASSVK